MRAFRTCVGIALLVAIAACETAEAPESPQDLETLPAVRAPELAVSSLAVPPGSLLNEQILTGAGVYVPTPGTTTVRVRQQAAGGGGGGAGAGGFGVAAGGGGNSGVYLEYIVALTSGGPYSAGTGGPGGTSAPTAGGTGGDATLELNGTTIVAKGGTGGNLAIKSSSGVAGPKLPAMTSTVVPVLTYGEGGIGYWSGPVAVSGRGGSSPIATGGVAIGLGSGGFAGLHGGGGSGGAAFGAINGGPGGDGMIIVDEYTSDSTARTPNGCTDVTLTSPTAPFAIALGGVVDMAATATCPAGQTPEFEFLVKRVRDAAFTTTMLGGYRTASSAVFTPPTVDTWCVSVAVRAVGALEASQAIATAVCGTVGGGAVVEPPPTVLPAAGWQVTGGHPLFTNGVWMIERTNTNEFVHELVVPPNVDISRIEFHFNRNSTPLSGEIQLRLLSRKFGQLVSSELISDVVSFGNDWTTRDIVSGSPIRTNADDMYWVSLVGTKDFGAGQPLFDGARVTFTTSDP